MRAELAARGEGEALAAARRVAEDLGDLRDRDRVRRRARALHGVGHVALVVGAVEVPAVPALREPHVQAQERAARVRARRDGARRGHAGLDTAVPVRDPEVLRARRLGVAGDHAQVVRERVHRGGRAAAVVDGRARRQDLRRALVERGDPVRRRVGPLHARGGARPERSERREGVRRRVAGERVLMRETRLARIDDRVVRGLMAVAAALDEIDALEIGAQSRCPAHLRLPARERGWPEDGGDGERDGARGDQNDSLHGNPSSG